MAKSNIFDKAKAKAPAKTKAKDEKTRIIIEDPTFFDKVEKLEQLQDTIKISKAKADMISDELKDLGREKWSELYEDQGKNPGSVMLEQVKGEDTSHLMFIPTDKYITINSDRAEELREAYGEEIVEEKTTFSFDNDMIELYGEVIANLIETCEDIKKDDREKIVKAVTTFSVAKGTIDLFPKFSKVAEVEFSQVMEDVKPVVALKNVEIIKG